MGFGGAVGGWWVELGEAGVGDGWVGAVFCSAVCGGGVGFSDGVDPGFFGLVGCVVEGGLLDLGVCRLGC